MASVKDYAIFTLDRQGNVTSWNDGAEGVKGYRADEIIGRPISCFYLPEDVEAGKPEANLRRSAREGRCDDEGWRVRKDGSRFWAVSVIFPLRGDEGNLRGFVKITCDMTDRKQAEEERSRLYAAERAAREVAEKARQQQAFLAEASIVLESSLEYETTLGAVAHLAIPMLADWCVVYIAQDDQTFRRLMVAHANPAIEAELRAFMDRFPLSSTSASNLARIPHSGESILNRDVSDEEITAVTSGQEDYADYLRRIGLRSAMVVPMAARGQILGALMFAATERRYTPDDLALAEALARRSALAIDNARLYRQAREAVLMRDAVLASVSHDLRQPLSIIQGYALTAERRLAAMPLPETVKVVLELEKIDRAARRMGAMIQLLVDTAQLLMGRHLKIRCSPTDLVRLVREAVEDERIRLSDKTRIRVEADVIDLVGQWDSERITRVIGNLVGNGIKYSPNGGDVVVRVRREESTDGPWAVVEVQDQGIGIPAAGLAHIFEHFHRGANAVGSNPGTEIGLATVKAIIEQHGGSIHASSQEGVGSTFTVRLPISPPPVATSGDSSPTHTAE